MLRTTPANDRTSLPDKPILLMLRTIPANDRTSQLETLDLFDDANFHCGRSLFCLAIDRKLNAIDRRNKTAAATLHNSAEYPPLLEKSYACREREKVVYLPNFPNNQAIILICHMHNVSQTREDRFLKFNIYQVNMCSKYISFTLNTYHNARQQRYF
jgi:hypothetical protein